MFRCKKKLGVNLYQESHALLSDALGEIVFNMAIAKCRKTKGKAQ